MYTFFLLEQLLFMNLLDIGLDLGLFGRLRSFNYLFTLLLEFFFLNFLLSLSLNRCGSWLHNWSLLFWSLRLNWNNLCLLGQWWWSTDHFIVCSFRGSLFVDVGMESNGIFALFVIDIVVSSSFIIPCLNVPAIEALICWLVVGLFVLIETLLFLFICCTRLKTALFNTLFCFLFLKFKFFLFHLKTACVKPRMNWVHDLFHDYCIFTILFLTVLFYLFLLNLKNRWNLLSKA